MYTRKKQYITLAILVAAVITLSIGFAAFSNLLTINSEATVTPDQGNFKVVFSNRNNSIDENPVTVTKTPNSISATNGVIDNTSEPTLTNLSATFTEPGQKVEYNLYVYNAGAYVANLNSVTFRGTKSCTPGSNTVNYVNQACNSISMTVKVGNSTYSGTTQNITGHSLAKQGYEAVKVTIEYASNGVRADGPFSVNFPDVSLYYVTKTGTNEQVASTFTGTIYRHSKVPVANKNSTANSTQGVADTIKPWCVVVPGVASSCIDNEYGIHYTYDSKEDCEAHLQAAASNPEADAQTQALVAMAVCEQGQIEYQTSASNISEDYYLKHEVANDIITASYACFRYTDGVQKEVCLRGGDGGASYGTYDGISSNWIYNVGNLNPTGNIAVLESTRSYFEGNSGSCNFRGSNSICNDSSFYLDAYSDGSVYVHSYSDDGSRYVYVAGYSGCR